MKDQYKILGVKRKATKKEIKNAYRDKAKTLHPDKGGNAEEFKELSEAYRILSNDRLRLTYDATGGVSATENQKLVRAIDVCMQALAAIINALEERVMEENIFALLRKTFEKNRIEIVKANKEMGNRKKVLLDLNIKVSRKVKTEYPDVFQTFIENAIKELDAHILNNEEHIEVYGICIKIVETYSMRVTPRRGSSFSDFIACERKERKYADAGLF